MIDERVRILVAADEGRLGMNASGRYVIDREERPERKEREALMKIGYLRWSGRDIVITYEGRRTLRRDKANARKIGHPPGWGVEQQRQRAERERDAQAGAEGEGHPPDYEITGPSYSLVPAGPSADYVRGREDERARLVKALRSWSDAAFAAGNLDKAQIVAAGADFIEALPWVEGDER